MCCELFILSLWLTDEVSGEVAVELLLILLFVILVSIGNSPVNINFLSMPSHAPHLNLAYHLNKNFKKINFFYYYYIIQ